MQVHSMFLCDRQAGSMPVSACDIDQCASPCIGRVNDEWSPNAEKVSRREMSVAGCGHVDGGVVTRG